MGVDEDKRRQREILQKKINLIQQGTQGEEGSGRCRNNSVEKADNSAVGMPDAYRRLVRLVSVKDRSSQEIAERLLSEGYDNEEVSSAVDRATSCGLLDDMRYAEIFIRQRFARGEGRGGIGRALRQKGIDEDAAWQRYVELNGEVTQADEEERALHVLQRHPSKAKNGRAAAYGKLVAKGYSSDVAQRVARRWLEG